MKRGMQNSSRDSTKSASNDAVEKGTWVLDRIPEGCLLVTADWTISHINPEAERVLVRTRSDLYGRNLWDVFPDAAGGTFHSAYHKAMAERADVAVEGYYHCLESWFRVQARPWGTGLAIFFRDVAREHRIAEQVVESEAQLRDFVESATDLIHMLAPDGRILYANRAWRETLGYTEEEIAQLSMLDIVASDSRDTASESLRRTLSGVPVEIEVAVLAKDGRRIIVRGHANCRFVDGVPAGTRGIYRDVTAEREAAECLRKAQRIEASAMRSKTAFLDRVSHELRTPLAAIIGFGDILLHNRGGHLDAMEVKFLERIAAQGRNLLTLVEDVLAYAEIEARSLDLDLKTVDVAGLLREVVDPHADQQERRSGIPIRVQAPLSAMLATDASTLRRIIRYLVDDAIKRAGASEVSVRLLVDPASGSATAIEVSDEPSFGNGGIAGSVSIDPSVTLELGLTVARSLCQLLGYHFVTETNELGATTRRIELREAPQRDQRAQDEMATTLHTVLEASPLPIITFDPDWTVRVWNDAASRLFGWTSADVVGKRLPVLRSEDESAFRELLRQALESPTGIAAVPATHARSDGSSVDVHASIAPLRSRDGRLRGFISIVADVSERNRLESELRQAQKMEVVGRLAGGIAHDFNNLLTVISAHSEFLLSDIPVHDKRRDDAIAIRDVARRAADLTRHLLLFARKEVPERRVVDLNRKLANTERMLRRTLGSKIAIVTTPDADPVLVHADPSQMEQVIMNLALNARDAMPQGGTLVLTTATVAGERGEPGHAILTVSDTGVGIDAATRDHIFEPFFTTKERGEGTGLGLATVYTIVKETGGSVSLESEPGEGTTFRVQFPLATSQGDDTA
jgi:PAS domain S-box-containing protein